MNQANYLNTVHWRWCLACLIGLALTMAALKAPAQGNSPNITLNVQEAPLSTVLDQVAKQSGYSFIMSAELLAKAKKVTLSLQKVPLEKALEKIFENQPLSYQLKEKKINLIEKKVTATSTNPLPVAIRPGISLLLTVTNADGEPLPRASVKVEDQQAQHTNEKGKLQLNELKADTKITISYLGYSSQSLSARQLLQDPVVVLQPEALQLNETIVQGKKTGTSMGTKIDLKHRQYQNLAQVLEGAVPGLTIKRQQSARSEDRFNIKEFLIQGQIDAEIVAQIRDGFLTEEETYKTLVNLGLLQMSFEEFKKTWQIDKKDLFQSNLVQRSNTVDKKLFPELRGATGFSGNGAGMLVVIDGLIQPDFPADYPMSNVASIEVVKDPVELVKWGPEAIGGVILITTNGGGGQLRITYNTGLNLSARTKLDRAALQQANSAQLLDYYKEVYLEKRVLRFADPDNGYTSNGLNQAQWLLYQRQYGSAAEKASFQQRWDALAATDNNQQLALLQQREFSQNHNLNVSGGQKWYKFGINSLFNSQQSEALGNLNRNLDLNLHNQFSLLDNQLRISWLVNYQNKKSRAGTIYNQGTLPPYQLLLHQDGSYVYDYVLGINPSQQQKLLDAGLGYVNQGVNLLEDARSRQDNRLNQRWSSILDMNWQLSPSLSWSSNLQYNDNNTENNLLQGWNHSSTRRQYNHNGVYDQTNKNAEFYMPMGDILKRSFASDYSLNLRTGLHYSHVFEEKHVLSANIGLAGFNQYSSSETNPPLYSYNSNTGQGVTPKTAPTGVTLNNFLGGAVYPTDLLPQLLPTSSKNRNFSVTGNLSYTYDQRFSLTGNYNVGFMPSTIEKGYTSSQYYNMLAGWVLSNEKFFKVPFINKLKLLAGTGEIHMAQLPAAMMTRRIQYPEWDNRFSVVVSSYNPTRQNGQVIRNYDGIIELGILNNNLQLQFNYRHNTQGEKAQLSGRTSYHISKERYFKVPFISNLLLEGFVSSMSAGQVLSQMMSTNLSSAAGFGPATANRNMGALPPSIVNKELHLNLGLFKDRMGIDLRYYHKTTSGNANGLIPADPTLGFAQLPIYSQMQNKGWEFRIQGKLINHKDFSWTSILNAAYNINMATAIPTINYLADVSYLTTTRNGYATDNLWSYRWAGLDKKGQPQVYNNKNEKVMSAPAANAMSSWQPDDSWLVYSGRTTAPWTGALIQEWTYKSFFARTQLNFNMGHVMRRYLPVAGLITENSVLLEQRWRKPGDEAFTEIAAVNEFHPLGQLTIQNSDNSIVPADFIRLQEIQLGCELPEHWLKKLKVKSMLLSLQLQDIGLLWARNKFGLDPTAIQSDGRPGVKQPMRYSLSLNLNF